MIAFQKIQILNLTHLRLLQFEQQSDLCKILAVLAKEQLVTTGFAKHSLLLNNLQEGLKHEQKQFQERTPLKDHAPYPNRLNLPHIQRRRITEPF
jgi:hypothetical protein